MASKGSGISFTIRKATKEDLANLQKDIHSFNMSNPENYKVDVSSSTETTFIAVSGTRIIGFITATELNSGNILHIEAIYNRLGYDRKGIGSKLLGKMNEFAVARKYSRVTLAPSFGFRVENGKKIKIHSDEFYKKKTNYKESPYSWVPVYFWDPKKTPGTRKPKIKPPVGLSPSNLMNPNRILQRIGRR